jgi:hypothetical protein
VDWWKKVLYGPDDIELSRTETRWLINHVAGAMLALGDEDDDDEEDAHDSQRDDHDEEGTGQLPEITLPDRCVTLG